MNDLMQLVDEYAKAYHTRHESHAAAARQRVADYIESIGAGGVSGSLFGATAAAQGFRDGQAAEHPDTARLRAIAEKIMSGEEPSVEIVQRMTKELPEGVVKTLEDLRLVADICRGAV